MMDKGIETFIEEIKQIIDDSRSKALRSVDFCRVQMYWAIGKRISEKEQQGKERADYGKYIIRNLSKEIEPLYGSGFGVRQLELSRQFYRTYPNANTLCSQLNWSQYKLLIAIPDPEKREYYQVEAVNECWSKRQLERQISSMLYERLLLSNDKEAVLAVARNERVPESPQEIIKNPMVLEFLGLERKAVYAFDNEVLGEQGALGRKTQGEVVLTRHLRMALKRQNPWMMDKQMTEAEVTYSQG